MNELSLLNTLFSAPDFGFNFPAFTRHTDVPSVDVKETKDTYELAMDLPGKTEADVDLCLKDNVLTIASSKEEQSEKKSKEAKDEGQWLIRERHSSSFTRRFSLPKDCDSENVTANFKNGVLTVTIPRKSESKEKRIAITVA